MRSFIEKIAAIKQTFAVHAVNLVATPISLCISMPK